MKNFYNENGSIIDTQQYETVEQQIADKFISQNAIVLELGARYGVVATCINKRLTDTRHHFVVEPDESVFGKMRDNLSSNGCNPHVFNGVISNKPLYFQPGGLASRTRETACSCDSFIVPNKTLNQIIEETGLKFDTLVADCEGCLEGFIDDNIDYLDNFKLITYESDFNNECDYEKIERILREHNFVCIHPGGHSVWTRQVPPPNPPARKLLSFLRTR
jgi:FkbM family methyltransferase